jgi:hypothetical protein
LTFSRAICAESGKANPDVGSMEAVLPEVGGDAIAGRWIQVGSCRGR